MKMLLRCMIRKNQNVRMSINILDLFYNSTDDCKMQRILPNVNKYFIIIIMYNVPSTKYHIPINNQREPTEIRR